MNDIFKKLRILHVTNDVIGAGNLDSFGFITLSCDKDWIYMSSPTTQTFNQVSYTQMLEILATELAQTISIDSMFSDAVISLKEIEEAKNDDFYIDMFYVKAYMICKAHVLKSRDDNAIHHIEIDLTERFVSTNIINNVHDADALLNNRLDDIEANEDEIAEILERFEEQDERRKQ